jgi:hypothetical protein
LVTFAFEVWLSCWTIRRECDRTECQDWPKSRRCDAEDGD